MYKVKDFHTRDSKGNFIVLREVQYKFKDGSFKDAGRDFLYVKSEKDLIK